MTRWFCFLLLFAFTHAKASANPWNGKVVLQGFWWDYWNNNYANDWSTYLADLAPRLREMGIDAVWIPPTVKNKNATGSVGYSPFDHYDLGDKFQGGSTATRFGTKDQYLRAVAIFHANGIDVIQDVVWNHMDGAGTETGAGGQDPAAPSNQWKNFRYVSFATPGTNTSAANYGARRGRFPKNWQNFHPNPDHNHESDDITAGFFGPDICFYREARGLSSNMSFNPLQGVDYMRNGMRAWSVWMKKQTGVDGFRLDAVKHFEPWVTQDFLWNLSFNAGFASGGSQMFAIGEYVGSAGEMDAWVDAANSANGGTADLVGTFDFSLRGALKGVIDGLGTYNLGSLPGAQQNRRSRTAPFVNSHDTFRPMLDGNGRYIGWDGAHEIGGHIDPNDSRIQLAYAVALAVNGSPVVFFEDLFDLHSTGRRWTHSPTNRTHLPARGWLTNQIWCHQNLNFKEGAYNVRWQAADLLVIERGGRALIAVNDHFTATQTATVQTDFGANVALHDYSGAYPGDVMTDANGRVTISAPPCNGTNIRRGYSIWGPANLTNSALPSTRATTQEWEMADDLGDSHPSSLRQGGALPANSIATRDVGVIFAAANQRITLEGFSSNPDGRWHMKIFNTSSSVEGVGNLRLTHTPTNAGFLTIQVRNATATEPSQKVWVRANYFAPRSRFSRPPSITMAVTNIFIVAGETATSRPQVTSNAETMFHWLREGFEIPSATAETFTTSTGGVYTVRVLNEAGLAESGPVVVTVYDDSLPDITNVAPTATDEFTFRVDGKTGLRYRVESSTDLMTWSMELTAVAPFDFRDDDSDAMRFYRIVYAP